MTANTPVSRSLGLGNEPIIKYKYRKDPNLTRGLNKS